MITIEDTRNLIVHYTESDLDYNSYNFENNETLKDCFGYWILYDSETHSAIVLLGLYEQNQQLETEITRELLESDKYLDVFFYYLSRIEYNYSNNGVTQIPVINREEYKRRLALGLEIPSSPNVTNTRGPIHIDIDPRGLPIIIKPGETEQASLRLYIKNVGTGAPIKDYDIGNITIGLDLISNLDVEFANCLGATSGTHASQEKILRRGESITIPCVINIKSAPTLYDYISIVFKTDYRYYIEQPLTVTIVGTE